MGRVISFYFLIFFLISCHSEVVTEKLAIIDTGIDLASADKTKLYFSNKDNCWYNFNTEESFPCDTKDYGSYLHGSTVYKIVSANVPNNSILSYIYASQRKSLNKLNETKYPKSLKEVYYNKQQLIRNSEILADSVYLAIKNNASVINISIGDKGLYSKKLETSIINNPNVLFIFSAGNESLNLDYNKSYPCSIKAPNTICVGSKNENGLTNYTNYGSDVDIYLVPLFDEGTSFSAPIISNEAFLLKLSNKLSAIEIKKYLLNKYK